MSYHFDPVRKVYVRQPRKINAATYAEHFRRYGAPAVRLRDLPTYQRITSREGLCR